MAESAVDFLLQTISSVVQHEASLILGFRSILDQWRTQDFRLDRTWGGRPRYLQLGSAPVLDEIQLELQSMRSFLKDADRKMYSDDGVKTWVGQVRQAAYKVEDIIDEYRYNIAANEDRGGAARLVMGYYYRRQTASMLRAVKSEICQISERRNRYDFQIEQGSTSSQSKDDDGGGGGENWQRSAKRPRFIPDDDIVGIEEKKDFLIRRLIDQNLERVVLSVVGMAGVGKTTLVTKAYDSPQVKNHFQCHALITVSQSYKFNELLRTLMKELCKSSDEHVQDAAALSNMNTSDLVETVFHCLQNKRYVIVLDDVWDPTVWEGILDAVPNNGCGGRIMFTTRNENVISSSFGVENVLRLEPLGYNQAFLLFCKNAFPNKRCPPELNQCAYNIVQKCEGLPLAIVAIGRLMSRKEKSSLEWKKLEANLSWQLRNNKELERLQSILLLSYNDLPHTLKNCFLYCSLFPEDARIQQKRLIRLWVAEGFIEERGQQTLEDVAADFIRELICRNMLQVVEQSFTVRKLVRMHDVFRELAISIGREENFCDVNDGKEGIQKNAVRRLSMSDSMLNIQSSTSNLRSLMLFATEIPSISLKSIASSIKLLRVLDLKDSPIKDVPDEIVELLNLCYLNLRGTNVQELPQSISKLRNLQTLDIRDSGIKTLPKEVEKLKKLRHLFTYAYNHNNRSGGFNYYDFAQVPAEICDLKCLQTLQCIGADHEIVKKIGNLTQIRKLTIAKVESLHGVELCASLEKLKSLLMLRVQATTEEEILHLDALSHPPGLLEDLILSGRMERLPSWLSSLQALTRVSLQFTQLNEDPLTSLQALPNLLRLQLFKAFVGKELRIRRGCFLKLKVLSFGRLPQLSRIYVEEESLDCIEVMNLNSCPELRSVPEGIQYLTSLQRLHLRDMSEELLKRISEDGGRLLHIPYIVHYDSTKGLKQRFFLCS